MKVAVDDTVEQQQRKGLKYIDAYYTVENDSPIIHLIARDGERNRHVIDVTDFAPYFCVPRSERTIDEWEQLAANDWRVTDVQLDDEDVDGQDVVKVVTQLPRHVKELRDSFAEPLEADVRYETRFLVDTGIQQCFTVPHTSDDSHVRADDVEPIPTDDPRHIDVPPRICYFDIEVQQSDDGAAVVSEKGTELALNPITAIAAYDNYTDTATVWLLVHSSWDEDDAIEIETRVNEVTDKDVIVHYSQTERELLVHFCSWVADRAFDVITGWNSNSFDVPYLVNRCLKEKEIIEIYEWSPTRDVETMDGEGGWLNSDLKGMIAFDMLNGFEKTEYTELDSFALDDVAAEVVDASKTDVGDIDDSRVEEPATFAEYVLRDALLVRAIDQTRGILTDGSEQ